MQNIIVAGTGTEVGKTVVSAIITTSLKGEYWKPIQCGPEHNSDSKVMKKLLDTNKYRIHPSVFSLKTPVSPHHAARLEDMVITKDSIVLPQTTEPLIIEGVGGVLVPLNYDSLCLDVFKSWQAQWIIVSRHYLGSINHTLLTIEALKNRGVTIAGIVFNGCHNHDTEGAILEFSQIPLLGRLLPEDNIDRETIKKYAGQWKESLMKALP